MSEETVPEHQRIQELLGVYALDAVDPETATLVERHLGECVRCSVEVAQHHEVAGLLANSGGESPAELWDGIAAELGNVGAPSWERLASRLEPGDGRSERPVTRAHDGGPGGSGSSVVSIASRPRSRWAILGASLVATAALVIALVLGAQVDHLHHQVSALRSGPLAAAAERSALEESSTKQVRLTPPVGGRGSGRVTVVLTAAGTGFVDGGRLRALPPTQTYQLWGVIGGRTISLGLLGSRPSVVPFSAAGEGSVQAFAITAERAGGVVQSAHRPVVAGPVGT